MRVENADRRQVEAFASALLERLQREGVAGDIIYSYSSSAELSLRDGEIEEATSGFGHGVGIRTIRSDGRQGVASGSRLDSASLDTLLDWSLHNSAHAEPEECVSLYKGEKKNTPLDLYDPEVLLLTADRRMELCQEMTSVARKEDSRIRSVRAASWADGWGETFYASTAGFSGWKRGTFAVCSLTAVLQEGESTEMGGDGQHERFLSQLDVQGKARSAIRRTGQLLGGKPVPTGRYTLVLDPPCAAALIDEIASLFCASEIHKGHSLLAGKMGATLASPALTLVDEGRMPRGIATADFDAEGVPTQSTPLLEKGVVSSFLYNLKYAALDGVTSTGSAVRGLASLPDVGTSNVLLRPGENTPEQLISSVGKGVYVMEMMGLHTLDPVSGDFSLGIKGRVIEHGALGAAVSGVTIAGNLLDLLLKIRSIGADFVMLGSVGACTMVVDDVAIAGL